jgi:hypothetical protein
MATTYEKIQSTTLGTASATIDFTSIPATYTDLRLVVTHTGTSGFVSLLMTYNNNTASNYSNTYIYGDGSTAGSSRSTNQTNIYLNYNGASTIPHLHTVDVFSYAGSTFKTCLVTGSEDTNGSGIVTRLVGLWRQTSAITSLKLTADTSTYAVGTTATLYGILKA